MKEIWKAIEGYEGLYEISNLGNVKALDRYVLNNGGMQHRAEKILKPRKKSNGYKTVALCKDGKITVKLVHRLVAIAFIPNPENKPIVDHIDSNRLNNRADNLRWFTCKENLNTETARLHNSDAKKGHPCYLKKHSEETKKKISEAHKGREFSDEHRKKLSESHKGKVNYDAIDKIRKANTGKQRSEEARKRISEGHKGILKGKHWRIEDGKRIWY